MATLTVPVTTNFTGQSLFDIDQITMSGNAITATFSSAQFGAGLISNAVIINNSGDNDLIVVNMAAAGTFSAAAWTYLAAFNLNDRVIITGTLGVDTITGSSGRDIIGTGGGDPAAGADHLFGGSGDDQLRPSSGVMTGAVYDGGANSDLLSLTTGSVTYDLRTATINSVEVVFVGGTGIAVLLDHTQVGAGNLNQWIYAAPSGALPTLTITGGDVDLSTFEVNPDDVASITITGDATNGSTLIGSLVNDTITGGLGADTLSGHAGNDRLFGGRGNDTFLYDQSIFSTGDTVSGGSGFSDRILLSSATTYDLSLTTISTTERLQFGAGGATVFMLADQLLGASDISQIIGGAGVDTLNVVGQTMDLTALSLGGWTDGVDILNLIGTVAADTLTGSTVSDSFDAVDLTATIDAVAGGLGNDVYLVDQADTISETTGNGTADRVQVLSSYVLAGGPDIEFLETADALGITAINLTGNALAQTITGNAGGNVLDGAAGAADTLTGGAGNDSYVIRNAATLINETASQGSADRVLAAVNFVLAADDNIEVVQTTAAAGLGAINLTGNALAQSIFGNAGINTLEDGAGAADTLTGAAGNDTYVIRTGGTIIVEGAGQGTGDRVLAAVSFGLAGDDNIEVMQTTSFAGAGAINLTGNALAQTIIGNAGANALRGAAGNDTLTGGGGADDFVFNTALGATNIDGITDFVAGLDDILLRDTIFTGIGIGALAANEFHAGASGQAQSAATRIIYETDNGNLWYDADGTGAILRVQFGDLVAGLAVTAADFAVF